MRRLFLPGALSLAVLASLGAPRVAAPANGAWQTFIRPVGFSDLLALQDEVWCATEEGGLLRFDRGSSTFEVLRREPGSIASNRLTRLALDRSGRLWVGTRANGVSRRAADGSRWDVVNVLDGLSSDSVTVLEPQGDTLWIGTARGIALWNGREISGALPDGFTFPFDTTFANPAMTGVAVMGDSLWLSTRRGVGLAQLSNLLGDWRPANQGLPSTDVRDLASDGTDLFARIGNGVHRFRFDLGTWVPEAGIGAVYNLEDDGGTVLAGTSTGLLRWTTIPVEGWTLVGDALAPAAGAEDPEFAVDPTGGYFAALGEVFFEQPPPASPGVASISRASGNASVSPWIARPTPDGPIHNDLVQVALDGPRVYLTAPGRGFDRFDGTGWYHWGPGPCSGAACDTTFVEAAFAFGLMVDPGGRKWVGCWSPPPEPQAFGPGGALTSFDDSMSPPQFRHHVVVSSISQPLEEIRRTWMLLGVSVPSGERYLATDTPRKGDINPIGLEVYDANGDYRGYFDTANSTMSGLFVHGLAITRNGLVWVGYDGAGLDFVAPPAESAKFIHVASTNGLAVRGLAAHGDSVWVLTNTELRQYSANAGPNGQPAQTIPVSAGQAQLAAKPLATGPDGRVWFATTAGLQVVLPGGARESFTIANSPLPDDEVRAIAVDPATGVAWLTTPAGLARFDPSFTPPAPPPIQVLRIRVYPNPATVTRLGIQLRLTGDASAYTGEIYDLSGRRLRRFFAAGNGVAIWDGRDDGGNLVKPGVYFVRAWAGGRAAVTRVVLLH